jgi:GPH family glycoside/pentoside/hexuronide:cation symporter
MKLGLKIGYGIGQFAEGAKAAAFASFLFFYFNQVLGLSGSLAGIASLLALTVDALTDPMIGQISDNWRSRWGRRHPFMFTGAVPFGVAMVLLFSPPAVLGQWGLFAWLLGWAVAVRLMMTLFFVPHLALGAELAPDYHERTSLIGYRVFFSAFGSLLISVLGFAFFFPASAAFSNGLMNAAAYQSFGLFVAGTATAAMLWSIAATRHTIPALQPPSVNSAQGHPLFAIVNVFVTLRERSFRVLFFSTLMFNVLVGISLTLVVYIATFVFGFSTSHLALLSTAPLIGMVLASHIAQLLSRRLDKRLSAALCAAAGAGIASIPMLLFLAGGLDALSIDQKVTLVYITSGCSQGFYFAFVILMDSMLSDTAEQHELSSGRREEGLFFAARSFATKASFGLGSFFAGIALDLIAFPRGVAPEAVPAEAVTKLAILGGPVLTLLFVFVLVIIRRYPLDAKSYAQIRASLDEREALSAQ